MALGSKTTAMVDNDTLLDYMRRFVGFGSPTAGVWFVGLEQGGGENLVELERRLTAWVALRRGAFADLREYCLRLGELRWHGEPPRIQPTLGKLVRLVLAAEGTALTTDAVRDYQAHRFGRVNEGTVIAELMPLPSRNVSQWIYSSLTGVPGLGTREAYVEEYRPRRVALLRDAIRAAAPRAVIFLGLSQTPTWAEIADAPFTEGRVGALWAQSGVTRFVILKHPTAFGAKNEYFEAVGREVAA